MSSPPASFLTPSETLLWSGSPGSSPARDPHELAPLLLAVSWFAVAAYFIFWALSRKLDLLFLGLGALVLLGLSALNASRFLTRYRERTRRRYLLSNERVLLVEADGKHRAIDLAGIPELSYTEHGNGRGTVVFGRTNRAAEVLRRSGGRGPRASRVELAPALEDVSDPAHVYRLILRAQGEGGGLFETRFSES